MTDKKEKIHIIATGGTIDKAYSPSLQTNELRQESILPAYLTELIGSTDYFSFEQIMMLDSRDLTDHHRYKILSAITASGLSQIIITHGTDTMVETAAYLKKNLPDINKTIILTGAMIPIDGFYKTDAGFNLGYAIATAQQKAHGIYICMNGIIFDPADVQKNIEACRFEKISAA